MIEAKDHFEFYLSKEQKERAANKKVLITMPYGIGDAVYIGLSAVDQIVRNNPDENSVIDVMCNPLQVEMFSYDPRIHLLIVAEKDLFPTQDKKTWRKAIFSDKRAGELFTFLREQHYSAVFPGNMAFTFLHRLGAKVLYPTLFSITKDFLTIRNFGDAPASRRVRATINKYYHNSYSEPEIGEEIPLYMDPLYFKRSKQEIDYVKSISGVRPEQAKVMVVAPDTASGVTRPPTRLLIDGLFPVLKNNPACVLYVLPSFTDQHATSRLFDAFSPTFGKRVQCMPDTPRPSLLYSAALVDRADVLVTGDTGIMHLAAATKFVVGDHDVLPRNKTAIIALFGGTNPGLYGYHLRTKIIGRGRKDQRKIRPGFLKEGYNAKERDYFSHISHQKVTQAIESVF